MIVHQTMVGFEVDIKVLMVVKPNTELVLVKKLLADLVNELNDVYGERAIFKVIKGVK